MGPGTLLPPMSTTHLGSPPHHCPWDLLLLPCSSASSPAAGMQIGGGGRGGAQHLLALSPRLGVLRGPPPRICICTVTWDSNTPSCPRHTPRRALAQGAQTPLNQGALACLLPAPLTSRPSLPVCHFIAGPGRFFLSLPSFPQRESTLVGLSFPSVPAVARHTEIP